MMIWGMTLQPGYEYTELVDEEVRLSMASLECRPRKSQNGSSIVLSSHVVLRTSRGEFLLCTLEKGPTPQQNLDLVLQPREKVTFSVEGTGIVHLMGYTSESPDEQQPDDEHIDSLPPELEAPPSLPEEDAPLPEEHEEENIVVKNEQESVVIPILEEALEDMDQMAKNEAMEASDVPVSTPAVNVQTPLHAQSQMQGNVLPPETEEEYPYPDMSDEGWMQTPEPTRQQQQPDPGPRIDPSFNQGRVAQGGNMPSTSYSQSRGQAAGESSHTASSSASTGVCYPSHRYLPSTEQPGGSNQYLSGLLSLRATSVRSTSVRSKKKLGGDKVHLRKKMQISSTDEIGPTANNPSGRSKTFFLCRYCDRPFNLRSNCKVHERRHTGERPFKCSICPKFFVSGSERKAHENLHTGNRPYKCRYCEKSFASTGTRCHHEKKHIRDYSKA